MSGKREPAYAASQRRGSEVSHVRTSGDWRLYLRGSGLRITYASLIFGKFLPEYTGNRAISFVILTCYKRKITWSRYGMDGSYF